MAGDDSWVIWRAHFTGITVQTRLRDLAAGNARGFAYSFRPLVQRAQGMPGAGAPAAARVVVVSTRVSHHEYAGNTRHSPRNGFNACSVLSPATGFFATVTRESCLPRT
jgi:hypothetical protein